MQATNMNQMAKMIEATVVAGMETQEAETKGDIVLLGIKQHGLMEATIEIGNALGNNADFLLALKGKFDDLMSHLNAEDNEYALEIQGMIAAIASDRKEGY